MDKKGKCENLGENSSENVKISDSEVYGHLMEESSEPGQALKVDKKRSLTWGG